MDKKDVAKLKDQLPRNYIKILCGITGFSEASVYKTFSEKYSLIVEKVVDAAIDYIEQKKAADLVRKERIQNL